MVQLDGLKVKRAPFWRSGKRFNAPAPAGTSIATSLSLCHSTRDLRVSKEVQPT